MFIISSVIYSCAVLATLIEVNQVHVISCKFGFGSNMYVSSSLIDIYEKFGLREAYLVSQGVEEARSAVLWSAMISGFADMLVH